MRAPGQALALQAPEQVLGQAPEQALRVPELAQALQVPGLAQALPEQASVPRALAPGPAWLQPAVHQALAPHRLFQKYSKRQWPG
ncbi:conserved hypothetical protein [Mesorhizobium prunaredense]|uniref:Uncharacterized protein n=1 Tax=Mesorhizobium prunaredense TaxID=1631249 RepID=A0A1R3VCV8_9HYPH|nr:conserved hypothetical protein [Mesorhizobium prunaredense]